MVRDTDSVNVSARLSLQVFYPQIHVFCLCDRDHGHSISKPHSASLKLQIIDYSPTADRQWADISRLEARILYIIVYTIVKLPILI